MQVLSLGSLATTSLAFITILVTVISVPLEGRSISDYILDDRRRILYRGRLRDRFKTSGSTATGAGAGAGAIGEGSVGRGSG